MWQNVNFPNGLGNHSIGEKYFAAQYFAFTTMTTVGYGDILATTVTERAYAIVSMVVGGFSFSAIASVTRTLLNQRDLSALARKNRMKYSNQRNSIWSTK